MSLLRNFATVGSGTAASRLLGFIRDVLMAAAIGTGPVADAFFVAQRLPNLFRRLFAEGAFASAFVPLFTKSHEGEGAEAGMRFANESLAALAFALIILTIVAELGMVWLTFALAPGFAAEPEKFELAVLLSRITFPYLLLISIASLLSGALNGVNRFLAAALAPVLLNVVMILALILVWWSGEIGTVQAGIWLSASVTIAGVFQLAMLWIACERAGLKIRLIWPRWNDNVRRLVRLAGPSVLAGGVVQINIVVGTIIASLQPGAVSWLYYADRLYQLPLGIVGIALGVILLPDLSRSLAGGRRDLADHTQNRAMEFAAALTLPATIALLVIPAPIIAVLFERGAFTAADTAATAPALAAYAVGLPAFVAIKVLQPAFFAREDTWTPMWTGATSMLVNVVAAIVLFWLYGHVGIAAATSIAAWINTAQLIYFLHRRGDLVVDSLLRRRLPLLALASVLMGVGVWLGAWWMTPLLYSPSLLVQLASLTLLVTAGIAFFVAVCQFTGVVDFRRLLVRPRRGGSAGITE
jgi:putative peptidoglycan lipid II flippase